MKKSFHLKMGENALFNLKKGESASMVMHINEFNTIVSQMTSVDISLDEEVCKLILLTSLPNTWVPKLAAVSN